ncbi:MAG: geranylgeranylglyceryl/heptaprenylglyceryl phosphate synthase [Chitinivibrionia bacterium]|nr:geranylgeranylglyceryl/heptaprenylglyceryl phosphate synthase [Chitinivibrionia bacterium]
MSIYKQIKEKCDKKQKQYWILLDPDDFLSAEAADIVKTAEEAGATAVLIGGSFIHGDGLLAEFIAEIKQKSTIPIILFPGDASQIAENADAILFMSLISGRNPDFLIGQQIKGAVKIAKTKVEPISMGYMLVESGTTTSVEFMSNTRPLPREKPEIAAAHALAAQFLGMSMIYLEAGSGAKFSVSEEMITAVKRCVKIPVIVGGGIRDAETAKQKLAAGADIIITGNLLSSCGGLDEMKKIAETIREF